MLDGWSYCAVYDRQRVAKSVQRVLQVDFRAPNLETPEFSMSLANNPSLVGPHFSLKPTHHNKHLSRISDKSHQ